MTQQDDSLWGPPTVSLAATVSAQERLLARAIERAGASPEPEPEETDGEEHLLLWLGGAPYLVRLADLREVLPGVPSHIALPYSPLWHWGIFPLRTDLVALVDPVPMLLHGPNSAQDPRPSESRRAETPRPLSQGDARRALVIGEGERSLALVADRVGDILPLLPDDQEPSALVQAVAVHERYVAGVYPIAGLDRPALALHVAPLCEDIFAALEERPAHE